VPEEDQEREKERSILRKKEKESSHRWKEKDWVSWRCWKERTTS
jgi:hypothetical protein